MMPIKGLNFLNLNNVQTVQPVAAVASNPFNNEKALEQAGLKLAENPSLLKNPQAKVCYLA